MYTCVRGMHAPCRCSLPWRFHAGRHCRLICHNRASIRKALPSYSCFFDVCNYAYLVPPRCSMESFTLISQFHANSPMYLQPRI